MRLFRMVPLLVAAAALGLLVLWTVGPHSKPGSTDHLPQVLVFLGVVGVSLLSTRRVWGHRVSH